MTQLVASTIFEEELQRLLAQHVNLAAQIGAVLQFDLLGEGGGIWHLDLTGKAGVPKLDCGPAPKANCTVRIAASDFVRLVLGQDEWSKAFVSGRIDYSGDLVTALKIRKLLSAVQ